VEEFERIPPAEQVKPDECGGSRAEFACVQAGESGRTAQLDAVAEDRRCAEETKRLRRQPS
jgi:hypothetical protein